jgi:hypothetical protein
MLDQSYLWMLDNEEMIMCGDLELVDPADAVIILS